MVKCIFCLTTDQFKFNTREHVIPESLGAGDWALLPDGMFCDSCQNIFGSSIEQQALADYPFINLRTLLSIPTKKNNAPWFNYLEGKLTASSKPGTIHYEPNEFFKKAFEEGRKSITIIPAMTKKPDMILRMLLKIGLEVFGGTDGDVFSARFDAARNYALKGVKHYDWSYLFVENQAKLDIYIKGRHADEEPIFADVLDYDVNQEYLHFKLFYLDFFVPLIENVVIDPEVKKAVPFKSKIVIVK